MTYLHCVEGIQQSCCDVMLGHNPGVKVRNGCVRLVQFDWHGVIPVPTPREGNLCCWAIWTKHARQNGIRPACGQPYFDLGPS